MRTFIFLHIGTFLDLLLEYIPRQLLGCICILVAMIFISSILILFLFGVFAYIDWIASSHSWFIWPSLCLLLIACFSLLALDKTGVLSS